MGNTPPYALCVLGKTRTCAIAGLNGSIVEVEAYVSSGLPSFSIVGLPDAAVQESRERVRGAIRNSGYEFPMTRIAVNLAPADLRKEGPAYDLPMAVAVLMSSGQVLADLSETLVLGELSLDGGLRHTQGILPMVALGVEQGLRTVIVPSADAPEAALVEGATVYGAQGLGQVVAHLRGDEVLPSATPEQPQDKGCSTRGISDFSHIKGQEHAKRALEVAAAGGHNLLMSGPPGSGKTLMARALPGILPSLSPREAIDVTKVYSVSGLLPGDTPLITQRPFRSPHYTISSAGLVGGGRVPRPGEISLSHRGVLFLDELPEFGHATLEVLRQPLEDKMVTISRSQGTVSFPANFMLVGAMNPCPCGFYGDPFKECSCSVASVEKYQKRVSGPMLDRIDLFVQVPRVEYDKLMSTDPAEPTARIRERVDSARERQQQRLSKSSLASNADMTPVEARQFCRTDDGAQGLLHMAMKQLQLSARAFHRILKVSRTIADLAGDEIIGSAHMAEALQYRARGLG